MITKQLDCEARAGEEAGHKTTPSRSLVSEQKSPVLALSQVRIVHVFITAFVVWFSDKVIMSAF